MAASCKEADRYLRECPTPASHGTLLMIVAVLIKLDSPGSVFYKQERVGLNKRHFRVFKFRTMVEGR